MASIPWMQLLRVQMSCCRGIVDECTKLAVSAGNAVQPYCMRHQITWKVCETWVQKSLKKLHSHAWKNQTRAADTSTRSECISFGSAAVAAQRSQHTSLPNRNAKGKLELWTWHPYVFRALPCTWLLGWESQSAVQEQISM